MQTNHDLEKFIDQKLNKQTIFAYSPYLKTTKLRYWFIALNTHNCVELEV